MEPHRRKDTPPRRDPGSEQPGEQPEEVPVDPADPVDPAVPQEQGYVNSGVYEEVTQPGVDPNLAYVDPNQAYVDPNQAYVDPNQAYVDPNAGASAPPPAVTPNAGVYDEPAAVEPAPVPVAKVPKKKIVKRAVAKRRPAAPGTRSTYKRPTPSYSGGGGFSVMTVFLLLVAIGMIALIGMVMLPRENMESIAGYPIDPMAEKGTPRNLLKESQAVMISRSSTVSFSEEEVNKYLNDRLQGEQSGLMATVVKFKGVYVDFTPGLAEIVVEREIFGKPLTTSCKMRAEPFKSQIVYRPAGWTIGRIDLGSRNIKPIIGMFKRLRDTMNEEFSTMKQMVNVTFEQDRVILDPSV